MLSVDKKGKKVKAQPDTPQSELARLQSAIKRQQKRNQSLRDDLQSLVEHYQTRILPRERDLVFPIKLLIQRLIELFPRKALTQWQRREMMDWIMEEIDHLRMLDAEAARELAEQFNAMVAEFFQLTPDEIEAVRAQAEREFEQDDEEPDDFDEVFEELLRRATGQNGDPFQDDLFGAAEPQESSSPESEPQEELNAENWIKQLFRRTAKVLHPDREQDPQLREKKHHLMSALVDARDRGDIMAMLALFSEHVSVGEVGFSADEYPALIRLLQRQLYDLEGEEHVIIHASPFHAFLHRNLYSKQKPTQERKINAYLARIESEYRERTELALEIRSVKSLQSVLRERFAQYPDFDEWF